MTDIERLAGTVAAGDFKPIERYLAAAEIPAPVIVWNPDAAALEEPVLRDMRVYWDGLRGARTVPATDEIDPLAMGPALGYVMLLEALPDGLDFRYRLYGSRIAERSGFDMTGKRTAEVPTLPAIGTFFAAVYRAAALRGEPVFTRHVPPPRVGVTSWSRLVLPMAGSADGSTDFMVGNVPGDFRPPAG